MLKRISVGSAPYALTFGAGAVWVSNEGSGTVSRIAPKRNKVVKTIRVGGGPNGIAVAFQKVWVADYGHSHLIRIDPVRNRVEKRISLPKADWITPRPTRSGSRARAGRSTRSTRRRWPSWRP